MIKNNSGIPVYAYVPINIGDLDKLLAGSRLSADRMRLFFHQLFLSALRHTTHDNRRNQWLFQQGFVSADTRILRQLLTSGYNHYLNWAEEKGFIERRRNSETGRVKYTAGKFCQTIRISHDILHKPGTIRHFRKEEIKEYKALKAIKKVRENYAKRTVNEWEQMITKTHIKIAEMNKDIKFKIDDAEELLTKKHNLAKSESQRELMRYYLHLLEAVNDRIINYYTCDNYGHRLHTEISSLYSPLRQLMYYGSIPNEPLSYIDIKNSQVYLLACIVAKPQLIAKILPEFTCCVPALEKYHNEEDVQNFYKVCCEGVYEHFTNAFSKQKLPAAEQAKQRNKIKKRLISFLYSNPKGKYSTGKPSEFKIFFEQHYPNVVKAIADIKSFGTKELPFMRPFYTDHNGNYVGDTASYINLSRAMVLFESRVVLGLVAPTLIDEKIMPFTTVHDAFIAPTYQAEKIQKIIREKFRSLDLIPPKIKIESL